MALKKVTREGKMKEEENKNIKIGFFSVNKNSQTIGIEK